MCTAQLTTLLGFQTLRSLSLDWSLCFPSSLPWSSNQHKVSVMHAISVNGQAVQPDILAAGEQKVSPPLRRAALQNLTLCSAES